MALIIKQLWVSVPTETGDEWKECAVISLYKASMTHSTKEESISSEQMFAICYYPVTGECVEVPLNLAVIKELYDDKSQNITRFNQPEIKKEV